MHSFQIAVLPGDGIGPDVIAEASKVLRGVEAKIPGLRLALTEHPAGVGAYRDCGDALPAATLDACRAADAIFLGAMGLPNVRQADGTELTPQIDLREILDLYAGVRPIRLYHRAHSPLRLDDGQPIDFVIYRESTEGMFFSRKSGPAPGKDEARDTLRITRAGSERLFRAAFQHARRRRRKVTLVDKANVLPSMAFFRGIFDEIAAEFPDVETDRVYVDAAALFLVKYPQRFDVLVTENLFGDILSDLAAGLIGGMGMAPSGDIGDRCAVFQPSHGSAPDIAGKGIANPLATILSAAMMLEWLGTEESRQGARMIEQAVERVCADAARSTRDLGGNLSTSEVGDLVAVNL